jgi:hypothetical protein
MHKMQKNIFALKDDNRNKILINKRIVWHFGRFFSQTHLAALLGRFSNQKSITFLEREFFFSLSLSLSRSRSLSLSLSLSLSHLLEREFFLSLSLIFCPLRMMKSIKIVFIC